MFLDRLIPDKFLTRPEVCGVEVCIEAELSFNYTVIKNLKGKLVLVKTGKLEKLADLAAAIGKKKMPLSVVINGKGIITKRIESVENEAEDIGAFIREHLPVLNEAEFQFQRYRQEASYFLSFCRRDLIEHILSDLHENAFEVVDLFIGAPAVMALQPLWDKFSRLPLTLHTAVLENNELFELVPLAEDQAGQEIAFDDIMLGAGHVLSFAAGFGYFMQAEIKQSLDPLLQHLPERHVEKNKLNVLTVMCIVILFISCGVNALLYADYFRQDAALQTRLEMQQGKYERIGRLLADYEKNKGVIENAGLLKKEHMSLYADRIAGTVPEQVSLTEMSFYPKKEEGEETDSLVTFEKNSLVIKGNCAKSSIVSQWISKLKSERFVLSAKLEKFTFDNREGAPSNFEIFCQVK